MYPYKLQKHSEQATILRQGESKLADLSSIEVRKTSINLYCLTERMRKGSNFVCNGHFSVSKWSSLLVCRCFFMKFRIWCRQIC